MCKACGKAYANQLELERHETQQHSQDGKCSKCLQTFPDLSSLNSHLEKCLEDPSTDEIFSFSSTIDLEKSDIDDDAKRWNEIREQDWSTGYTTGQKKLEMLKQGDYKQVVIPTN